MKFNYAVVYERTPNNYGAYVPGLPGCIATAKSWKDIQTMIRDAIVFHIEGLIESGDPIPEPQMSVGEAMTYHIASLSDAGESVPDQETTFGMVEIEIARPKAAAVS
ncbi:MAG: type II toxin-antitoxin system HicB family antitoxin [Caldilineaceae bacterium]|nr:type II toxin-antitoxin system HicB family antitoxin [Caldilineaceae bacterium]MDE0464683.1 type II toxin-antitoxin system HicB family antitoxin [Caldilineaceae bacterium]